MQIAIFKYERDKKERFINIKQEHRVALKIFTLLLKFIRSIRF